MRSLLALLMLPTLALAQTFPTEFPAGAQMLNSESLKARLLGKVFVATPATGADIRIDYRSDYVYVNVGDYSDSGRWQTEGSTVCIDWVRQRRSCTEFRLVGDALYSKRGNNGEIVLLIQK